MFDFWELKNGEFLLVTFWEQTRYFIKKCISGIIYQKTEFLTLASALMEHVHKRGYCYCFTHLTGYGGS
jgi:hypothetical protein